MAHSGIFLRLERGLDVRRHRLGRLDRGLGRGDRGRAAAAAAGSTAGAGVDAAAARRRRRAGLAAVVAATETQRGPAVAGALQQMLGNFGHGRPPGRWIRVRRCTARRRWHAPSACRDTLGQARRVARPTHRRRRRRRRRARADAAAGRRDVAARCAPAARGVLNHTSRRQIGLRDAGASVDRSGSADRVHNGGPHQVVAFVASLLIVVRAGRAHLPDGQASPGRAPRSRGARPWSPRIYVFFVMFWVYGVVPHLWLTWADNELNWRPDKLRLRSRATSSSRRSRWLEPDHAQLPGPPRHHRRAASTSSFLGVNMWLWAWWQNRRQAAEPRRPRSPRPTTAVRS